MNKIFAIGLKDVQLIFRDRAALLLMLLAPFVITLGLGFVSGAFEEDSGGGGIEAIPVMLINEDEGELGGQLTAVFNSDELADLIELVPASSEADGRAQVDDDELAALVIIPPHFTDILIPNSQTGQRADGTPLEIYRSPSRPISASVIESVVSRFIAEVDANTVLITSTIEQLETRDDFNPADMAQMAGSLIGDPTQTTELITLQTRSGAADEEEGDFNFLAFLAPGMALFFLMYAVTLGGRSILQERLDGTMARLQTTATSSLQILGGKVFGIFLTGLAQVGVLIVGSTLLYGIVWGDWLAVLMLIVSAALAATGWGLFFASAMQTPEQVTGIGSAAMLLFGAISGTFIQLENSLVNAVGAITPNQWALQGFIKLGLGQSLADILPNIGALWLMAAVLFGLSVLLFQRQARNA